MEESRLAHRSFRQGSSPRSLEIAGRAGFRVIRRLLPSQDLSGYIPRFPAHPHQMEALLRGAPQGSLSRGPNVGRPRYGLYALCVETNVSLSARDEDLHK